MKSPLDQIEDLLGISLDWTDGLHHHPTDPRTQYMRATRNLREFIVRKTDQGDYIWKIYGAPDRGGTAYRDVLADSKCSYRSLEEAKKDIERFAREHGY